MTGSREIFIYLWKKDNKPGPYPEVPMKQNIVALLDSQSLIFE